LRRLIPILLLCLAGCASRSPFDGVVQIKSSWGFGTGAVIGRDSRGYVVATAAHVVQDDKCPLVGSYVGETLVTDTVRDVAILRVGDFGQGYTVLELADPVQCEPVMVTGWTYVGGARTMCYRGWVVSTTWDGTAHKRGAVVNTGGFPGTSGSPVKDSKGRCVGILRGYAPLNRFSALDSTTIISPAREVRAVMEKM